MYSYYIVSYYYVCSILRECSRSAPLSGNQEKKKPLSRPPAVVRLAFSGKLVGCGLPPRFGWLVFPLLGLSFSMLSLNWPCKIRCIHASGVRYYVRSSDTNANKWPNKAGFASSWIGGLNPAEMPYMCSHNLYIVCNEYKHAYYS